MSYDPRLLFERIWGCLQEGPCKTLKDLSQSLQLSERTIQKSVSLSTGKSFRLLRDEVILARVKWLFKAHPELPIKELSSRMGFESASSFSRAIKRASGLSPEEVRSCLASEFPNAETVENSVANRTADRPRREVKVAAL